MANKYIIGIDNGSQSTKVTIFDLHGNVVSEGRKKLTPVQMPVPGVVEHPDDDLWTSIQYACREALENFKGDVKDIIGIGLCTIRFCRAYLKEDGTLAQPVLSWMDKRVSKAYEDTNESVKHITTSSGYITTCLTGKFRDTAANYQGVWPIDTDTWKWSTDPKLYTDCNMKKEMLFELVMPGDILGHITAKACKETGLPEGLPVIATSNDKAVEALGAGLLTDDTLLVSLGTYICSMIPGKGNPKNSTYFWTNFSDIPNKYLYESYGIRRGMWMISWFCDILGESYSKLAEQKGIIPEELLNEEAKKIHPGSDGLMAVLDWLAPTDTPYRKGTLTGFDGRHTRAHIYRSILEGIAMTMKNNVDGMVEELGVKYNKMLITGGGAYSSVFMQIFADVFGMTITCNKIRGAVGLGTAINVAVSLGIYKDFETAVKEMVQESSEFLPNMENHELYTRLNQEVYKGIKTDLDRIHEKLYKITQ